MNRRNFVLGVLNGILFLFSAAFISSSTVLPVFITKFTDSPFVLGFVAAIEATGWQLPQVFVAKFLEDKPRKKFMYVIPSYIRFIAIFSIAIITFKATDISNYLFLFLVLYSVYLLGGGTAGISFMDIVSKAIPIKRRGSFWGMRMGFGGLMSLIAGYITKVILSKYSFPRNYAILFLIASVSIFIAITLFSSVKEPVEKSHKKKRSFKLFFGEGINLFRKDDNFKTLFIVRALFALYFMSIPFYIIYIKNNIQLKDSKVGYFIMAQMFGYVVSNFLWSRLSNGNKNDLVLRLASVCLLFTPLITLLGVWWRFSYIPLLLPFVFLGAGVTGMNTGYLNSLLAISPMENRQLYLGMFNTMLVPFLITPLFSGYVIRYVSYRGLFIFASTISILIFLFAYRLKSVRRLA